MYDLTQFKDLLGAPNTGLHAWKLFDIAIVDVLFTLIEAYLIARYTGYSLIYIFVGLIFVAIIIHRLFGVKTGLNTMLGLA